MLCSENLFNPIRRGGKRMLCYTSLDCLQKTCTYNTCFAEQKIILEQKGPANLAKLVLHLKHLCKEKY